MGHFAGHRPVIMKYMFFIAAVLATVPLTVTLLCERRFIRWAMLGLMVPMVVFNSTAINFFSDEYYRGTSRGMEVSIIYLFAAVILATFAILKYKLRLFPDWGSRLYLLYFIFCFFSLTNADFYGYSFFEYWKMVMMHLVFLTVYYYLCYSDGDFDIIMYGMAVVTAVNFVVVVQEHLSGLYQVRGIFPHQNSMAMCMIVAGTLFFARFFNGIRGFRSTVFLIAFALATASLIRTYSRGAIFCYPLAGVITLTCSVRKVFSARKAYWIVALSLIGAVVVTLFLPAVINRFQNAPESSAITRKNFAIAASNMIKSAPWAGVGLNNWGVKINPPYQFSEHRDPTRGYSEEYKDGIVETVYLLVASECGLPCLATLLLWLWYYWFSAFLLLKKLRNTRYFYIPAGLLGGLFGIYLQSILEWVLKQQMNFIWMMTGFAFLSYLNTHWKELVAAEEAEDAAFRTAGGGEAYEK